MKRKVGYGFRPTDEELITYFLKYKMAGLDSNVDDEIREINIYKYEPWELPRFAAMDSDDQEWYFFCRPDNNRTRNGGVNRSTKAGQWKSTGNGSDIKAKGKMIGRKKILVFYKHKNVKTEWVMHEYHSKIILPYQTAFVLYKLKKKVDNKTDTSACDEGEPSCHMPSDFENQQVPIPQVNLELLPESSIAYNAVEFDNPSALQLPIHVEPGLSLDDQLLINGLIDNSNGLRLQPEAKDQEQNPFEWADLLIVDPDEYTYEREYSLVAVQDEYNCKNPALPQNPWNELSPKMNFSVRDMDSEILYGKYHPLVETSNLYNSDASSKEYQQMQTVQAFTETLPSSNHGYNGRENNASHLDENFVPMSSKVSLDSKSPVQAICIFSREHPVYKRTEIAQHQIKSGYVIGERGVAGSRCESQGKLLGALYEHEVRKPMKHGTAIHVHQERKSNNFSLKEGFVMDTEQDLKMDRAKTSLKFRTNRLVGDHKIGSFIHLETLPLSHRPCPPSVCIPGFHDK